MKDLFGEESMRALSWRNPFGTLMLHGKIETRTWHTKYRGLVLICVSKKKYNMSEVLVISGTEQMASITKIMSEYGDNYSVDGMAIAVGRLVDCRLMKWSDRPKTFTDYNERLYCHIYEDVKPIKPFAWKGCQGWKKVDADIRKKIIFI